MFVSNTSLMTRDTAHLSTESSSEALAGINSAGSSEFGFRDSGLELLLLDALGGSLEGSDSGLTSLLHAGSC